MLYAQVPAPGNPGPAQAQLLVRSEQPAPGGGFYGTIDTLAGFNAQGLTNFRPFVGNEPPPNTVSGGPRVVTGTPGDLRAVARAGDPAPGTAPGVVFNFISTFPEEPGIGPAGQVTFKADLIGPGVTFENRQAVFYGSTPEDLRLLARAGGAAPGLPGVTFKGHDDDDVQTFGVSSNALGQVALSADLSDDTRALYVGLPDDLLLLARDSQVAPDAGGATWAGIGQVVLGHDGSLAMTAGLRDSPSGESYAALYAGTPDALRMVAREGDEVPGAAAGVTFEAFSFALHPDSNAGFVGVEAYLGGPGVDDSNNQAVLAADPAGTLYILARESHPFTVAPGDVRTVLVTSPPVGPSANGEVLFRMRFTDGTFLATVPEPMAAILWLATGELMLGRQRHGNVLRNGRS